MSYFENLFIIALFGIFSSNSFAVPLPFGLPAGNDLTGIDLIKSKGARLKTLDGSIDTANESPLAKATISLLGTFAQLERDLILDRSSEGRARAMAEGKKMGRPSKLSETQKKAICAAFHHQENSMSINALSKQFGVSRMTISRVVRKNKVG